jgi:altronate dehydratase
MEVCKPKLKSLLTTSSRRENNEITVLKLKLRCFEQYLLEIITIPPFQIIFLRDASQQETCIFSESDKVIDYIYSTGVFSGTYYNFIRLINYMPS